MVRSSLIAWANTRYVSTSTRPLSATRGRIAIPRSPAGRTLLGGGKCGRVLFQAFDAEEFGTDRLIDVPLSVP